VKRGLARDLWDCYVLTTRQRNQAVRSKRLSAGGRKGAWRRWHRERAILDRMPEVQRIARRVLRIFTHHIDLEELVQAGYVGLVSAANKYDPRAGNFAPYAYFRIRGEMIDSQKRRAYREAMHASLHGLAGAEDGWLPPAIDTDPRPLPDDVIQREQIHQILHEAIAELPRHERRVMKGHLAGNSLGKMARKMGRSLTWTRGVLAEAREYVRSAVVEA
jgi:RNA polymerase sigma factor (sigma-70 family)